MNLKTEWNEWTVRSTMYLGNEVLHSGWPNAVGLAASALGFGTQRSLQDGLPWEVMSRGQSLDASQGTGRRGRQAGIGGWNVCVHPGKDWRQKEKRAAEDEMVGWHHQLNGHEFEKVPGDGEGREAWRAAAHGVAETDMTVQLKTNTAT